MYQVPDLFPTNQDRLISISFHPSFHFTPVPNSAANAGSTTLSTTKVIERDPNKWEEVGKVLGGLSGAALYSLTTPVTLIDGPLPFVDIAWLIAGARFTAKASKIGGMVGEFVDDQLQ